MTLNHTPRLQAMASHLAAANNELSRIIATEREAGIPYFDRTEAVSDPVATPFFTAMRMDGWAPDLTKSGDCLAPATECSGCKRGFSRYGFTRAGEQIFACVYCDGEPQS